MSSPVKMLERRQRQRQREEYGYFDQDFHDGLL